MPRARWNLQLNFKSDSDMIDPGVAHGIGGQLRRIATAYSRFQNPNTRTANEGSSDHLLRNVHLDLDT